MYLNEKYQNDTLVVVEIAVHYNGMLITCESEEQTFKDNACSKYAI